MRRTWWWIIALGSMVGGLLWYLGRRRGLSPLAQAKVEILALEAARTAQEQSARLGSERAKAAVEAAHGEQLRSLNAKQKEQADALASDPAALARFIIRAGSGAKPAA